MGQQSPGGNAGTLCTPLAAVLICTSWGAAPQSQAQTNGFELKKNKQQIPTGLTLLLPQLPPQAGTYMKRFLHTRGWKSPQTQGGAAMEALM